jgi:DNA-binding SARP family transcriptional activator
VIWSVAIIGERLGSNTGMHPLLNVFEDFGAFLLPVATAHLGISVALEGRTSSHAAAVLIAGYAIGLGAWVQTAVDPGHPILPGAPHFEPFGIPGELLGWAFIAARAGMFAAGIGWLVVALTGAGRDVARQRQLQVMLATLSLGILGGMARILPEGMGGPPWVGVSMVAAAAALAVYAVLAQRLFTGAEMTARAFRLSLAVGFSVVLYVALLVALDRAIAELIGIDLPIVIAMAIVITIALFDPIADAVRRFLTGGTTEDQIYVRLLRALGEDVLSARRPEEMVAPAIARLVRMFDLTGAAVLDGEGRPTLVHGEIDADRFQARMPLDFAAGYVAFGPKRSALPLTPSELDLLRLATSYIDAALRLAERQDVQASALAELSREGDAMQHREAVLSEALAVHDVPRRGLHVYALGPLRAEQDGDMVRRWGGAKAGSRQAEAIFAFLFDRGERGAAKDEIVELIWPDIDLERADTAFHRTMLGLRSALAPGRSRAQGPIGFVNDRYRLAPDLVTWSDVGEFERLLAMARADISAAERLRLLEAARGLYRAELLDDCPFYGDSVHVEDRREELRERYVDLLVDIGKLYADRGDRSASADAMRRAKAVSGREDLPVASDVTT